MNRTLTRDRIHTIRCALRVAADQYRADAATLRRESSARQSADSAPDTYHERVALQFDKQARDADALHDGYIPGDAS